MAPVEMVLQMPVEFRLRPPPIDGVIPQITEPVPSSPSVWVTWERSLVHITDSARYGWCSLTPSHVLY